LEIASDAPFKSFYSMHLKVWFTDFWFPSTVAGIGTFYLYHLLKKRFKLELDSRRPDVLFYGEKGCHYQAYGCLRVAVLRSEPYVPRFMECDFAISILSHIPGRNYRSPSFTIKVVKDLAKQGAQKSTLKPKQEFCNFVYDNDKCVERNTFFKLLSHYKFVHAPGRVFRNTQGLISRRDKDFMAAAISYKGRFKFTIAFENRSLKNYVSEKIVHAFQCRSLPIYWGAPNISDYFNTKAFINCHDYPDFETVIRHIREVDENEELYRSYMEAPVCTSSSYINSHMDHDEKMLDALEAFLRHPPRRVNAKWDPVISRFFRIVGNLIWMIIGRRDSFIERIYKKYQGKLFCRIQDQGGLPYLRLKAHYGTDMDSIPVLVLPTLRGKDGCLRLQAQLKAQHARHEVLTEPDLNTDEPALYHNRMQTKNIFGLPASKSDIMRLMCYLSEHGLWKRLLDMDCAFAVILKGDVQIAEDFYAVVKTLPYIGIPWDVIFFCSPRFYRVSRPLCHIINDRYLRQLRKPPASFPAIMLSRKAIRRLYKQWVSIEGCAEEKGGKLPGITMRFSCVTPAPVFIQA
jgi:hypothetical protein